MTLLSIACSCWQRTRGNGWHNTALCPQSLLSWTHHLLGFWLQHRNSSVRYKTNVTGLGFHPCLLLTSCWAHSPGKLCTFHYNSVQLFNVINLHHDLHLSRVLLRTTQIYKEKKKGLSNVGQNFCPLYKQKQRSREDKKLIPNLPVHHRQKKQQTAGNVF